MAQLNYADIEIRIDDPLAISIEQKIDNLQFNPTRNEQYTIFRVPWYIREMNKNFYEPRIVSIGPYHWNRPHLKTMERQKLHSLRKLRNENPDVTVNMYLRELRELEIAARRCYCERIDMNSDEFVTMLFLDSIFIIQVVVHWTYRNDDGEDIVYDIPWNVPLIKSDLLMLENQIPFFVLEKVFQLYSTRDEGSSCSNPSNDDTSSEESEHEKASLFNLLVEFLVHGNDNFPIPGPDNKYDHLLHFYYDCYMSMQGLPELKPRIKCELISPRMIPCVTELKEAGIAFEKADSKSILDAKFSNGVLKIPYVAFEENTRPRIMNLLAFEQCSRRQKQRPLTSYAVLMDCIINTPKDVLILQKGGIFENKLAGEEEAAMFFNQLRYGVYLDYEEHHYAGLFGEVKKHCKSKWKKYKAKLCRDYFGNPWLILSLFAAVLMLFLTAIQSYYTVLGYYKTPH